jgi:mycofactocin system creatininase family protein
MPHIVVVPLGAWEQHGPHLPPDTDTLIITAVADAACASSDGVVLAPTLPITASDEHRGFDATLSIGTEAFAASVVAIARSAAWANGVLFVNGHGGNADGLSIAREAMHSEGLRHDVWSLPAYDGADMHAGRTETSVMLHLHPHLVDMSRAPAGNTAALGEIIDTMRTDGVRAVAPNGVLGDATAATAAHGRAVFTMWVSSLTQRLNGLATEWTTRA